MSLSLSRGLSFSSSSVIMVEEGKYGAPMGILQRYLTTDDNNGEGKRRRRRGEVLMVGSCCVFMIINFFERIIH